MDIRFYREDDLTDCAGLLMRAYNDPPWNDHWTAETASRYLREFTDVLRFVGFIASVDGIPMGAAFCHERTWWTKDELYVDEFFIAPEHQRQGCGKQLLAYIENYVRDKDLAGITLLTNRFMPAPAFYRQSGFQDAEHVLFMYKQLP